MTSPAPIDRPTPERLTQLLQLAHAGDAAALESVFATVYGELRGLAARQLAHERGNHTLQATALVHEAFLRLMQQDSTGARTPAEFLGVAALAMRRILVDHARKRGRLKRGGGATGEPRTLLDGLADLWRERAIDLVAVDEALAELAVRDAQKARLVELRFFAGLSMAEAAQVLALSVRTAEREWTTARAFLRSRLGEGLE
ncbi:MAG: sigma-70 family RNA polymerase sigma factor [Planctomycetes bacterium]|nr:sigma-70 family RNA polymerase sigma factor [Planctomycetota bacterium]